MNNLNSRNDYVKANIESLIKTTLVFLVIYACFIIFKPFLIPVVWAIIIAVALYPLHMRLSKIFGNKSGISATIITIVLLLIFIVPTIIFLDLLVESMKGLAVQFKDDTFTVPHPPDAVGDWPVVGKSIEKTWLFFSDNLTAALESFKPYKLATTIFTKFMGEKGIKMVDNSKATISSVVNGVLGTAVIQSSLIAIGFFVADVPGAPVLSIIVLFLAIIQIPTFLVVLPVVIYMFTVLSGLGAVLFTIWLILASISDNFLKPMLLGRGMEIPMLVILIGSIGGMILIGITGLFIGAVVFALGYQLFQIWVEKSQDEGIEVENTET
jgi:predicted PurR-regulated permease PerM